MRGTPFEASALVAPVEGPDPESSLMNSIIYLVGLVVVVLAVLGFLGIR